jgi:hypothetical protein
MHRGGWNSPPVIIEEFSISEAIRYLQGDRSATIRLASALAQLPTPTATTGEFDDGSSDDNDSDSDSDSDDNTISKKKKEKKTTRRKRKLDEGEEFDENGFQVFEENNGSGKLCVNLQTGKPWDRDKDCPVFAKNKCCNFFHPNAPAGTTGAWSSLNEPSKSILTTAKRGPDNRFGRRK